jgi:hypothetical protein
MTEKDHFNRSNPFKLELSDESTESGVKWLIIVVNEDVSPGQNGYPTASSLIKDGILPESNESTDCIQVNLVDQNLSVSPNKVIVRRDVMDMLCIGTSAVLHTLLFAPQKIQEI